MTGDIVQLETLASIVESGAGARERHGILALEEIVPAGHYRRRGVRLADTADLLPSEYVFNTYAGSLIQGHGPIRRFVLNRAVVTGQGSVVTRGRALLDESCWEFLAHGHVPHGLVREQATRFRMASPPIASVNPPSLLLKRPWWRNYGHWLVDAAALLALLMKHHVRGFEQVIIGCPEDGKLREIFVETISAIAPDLRIVEHPDEVMWECTELHYVEPVRRSPMCMLPEAIAALRAAVLSDVPPEAGGRRLLVSRNEHARRRLVNEPDVIAICQRYSFEVVFPERFTLREQATLFRSASVIAGVKGAAMANLVFLPPDASVIVLSPADFADPFFLDIAGSSALSYFEIFGPLTTAEYGQAQNPFTVDPARLDGIIQKAISVPRPSTPLEPTMSNADNIRFPPLNGDFYQSCLARIHAKVKPRTYLEIGALNGATLSLSRCRSVAIDPAFQLTETVPGAMPSLFLFQGTSDEFFRTVEPKAVLGGPIDLAFLDGMHLFEFLLRDFMNTERNCHPGSMIIMHDCIPSTLAMAGRDMAEAQSRSEGRYSGWWTGDAWKAADLLLRYRPDLDITALDAPPTGLIVVRKLDPSSTVLGSQYQSIIDSAATGPDIPGFMRYLETLRMYGTSMIDWFAEIEPAASS